jgi:hypothetical protein
LRDRGDWPRPWFFTETYSHARLRAGHHDAVDPKEEHDRDPKRQTLCANQCADHQPLGLQAGVMIRALWAASSAEGDVAAA